MQGTGVPRNPTLMIKWWRAAALQGVASSQCALAAAYRDGRMVRKERAGVMNREEIAQAQRMAVNGSPPTRNLP